MIYFLVIFEITTVSNFKKLDIMRTKVVELTISDIPIIMNLCQLTQVGLKDYYSHYGWTSWFIEGMRVWGIKNANNELIAIGSINFYDKNGKVILYSKADIAILTNGNVHPNYRGRGYQRLLIRKRLRFILRNRIYDALSFTEEKLSVSAKNLQRCGFKFDSSFNNDYGYTSYQFAYKNKFLVYFYKTFNYLEEIINLN